MMNRDECDPEKSLAVVRCLLASGLADTSQAMRLKSARAGRTPLEYAWGVQDSMLIDLLQPAAAHDPAEAEEGAAQAEVSAGSKRKHRTTPMAIRAERAGVAEQLRPMPVMPETGSDSPFRKATKAAQTANQQLVARAEEKIEKEKADERIRRITG